MHSVLEPDFRGSLTGEHEPSGIGETEGREAVMLGTLLQEQTGGVHEEQSIVGEGEHDTLVTMICQLLGSDLERIDAETEDVEALLPL